jgi:hypothetical protein
MTQFRVHYTYKKGKFSCMVWANSTIEAIKIVKKGLKANKKTGKDFYTSNS